MRRPRKKRLSISIDAAAEEFVRMEADRLYGGNVSDLFAELLREAQRFTAMERVIASSGQPRPTDAELDALRAEVFREPKRRERRTV